MSISYPFMSDKTFLRRVKQDPFNLDNRRNVNNSDKWGYNCAGYALQCFSWYMPTNNSFPGVFFRWDDYYTAEQRTLKSVEIMLADFPDLRRIATLDEVRDNEYAIMFRLSSDGDFHFIRRASNGHWFHKMGNMPHIDTMKASEVFDVWLNRYDGPIVILAKERR